MDPSKIRVVLEWLIPTTTKGVRGFLGLASYYQKFIQQFGSIRAPLNLFLSKDGFHWDDIATTDFHNLKVALTSPPILGLLDFTQPFVIKCDANGVGLGAVLTQKNRSIAYIIEDLQITALNLSTYEKEILAIIKSI